MKFRKFTALSLVFLTVVLLSSCGQTQASSYPAIVKGVTVEGQPKAVVSLSPAITNTIYELNLMDRLVGMSDYCPTLPGTDGLPKLGTAQNPNIEGIIAAAPQVVLTSSAMSKKNITALSDKGIKTIVIPSVSTLSELSEYYQDIAVCLSGNTDGAARSANTYENLMQRIDQLKKIIGAAPGKTYLFAETLSGNVATGDTLESDILKTIGLNNVAESQTSWVMDKDAIGSSAPDFVFYNSTISREQLAASTIFGALAAVQQGHAIQIATKPFEYQSTSVFDTLYTIAKAVYPDQFSAYLAASSGSNSGASSASSAVSASSAS